MSNLHSFLPELRTFAPYHSFDGNAPQKRQDDKVPGGLNGPPELSPHELALAQGAEEFRIELAARTEAMEAQFKADLETERKKWADEVGSELSIRIEEEIAGVERRICQSVQGVLLPFVSTLVPQAAIAEFLIVLKEALQEDFKGVLSLSGPEDMITAVRDKLESRKFEIACEPSAAVDIRAKSKDFIITTRIKSWLDELHGVNP